MAESTLSDVNRPKLLSSDTVMGVSSKSLYSGPQYNDVPRDWLKSQRYIVIVSFETNPCFNDIGEKQSQLFRVGQGYTVYRGLLNLVYGIFMLKFGY